VFYILKDFSYFPSTKKEESEPNSILSSERSMFYHIYIYIYIVLFSLVCLKLGNLTSARTNYTPKSFCRKEPLIISKEHTAPLPVGRRILYFIDFIYLFLINILFIFIIYIYFFLMKLKHNQRKL
jgi:hypothetical protein